MGRAPVSSKFWDLIHARTQHKKQQTNFAWWSNQTWRRFLQGRLRPLPGPQFWHECWRAICLFLSILTHGHIINTRDPKPRVSRPKTKPLGLQLAGCNRNLFIIHHFFHPFCSTGCRCRQSSWMKHRSGHFTVTVVPVSFLRFAKTRSGKNLTRDKFLSDPVSCRPVICCFWPHLLRPRPRPLKSGVWSQDQDHTWLGWYIRWRRLTNSGQNAVGYRCATWLYTVYVYDLWLVDVSYCFMVSTYVCALGWSDIGGKFLCVEF